jgi:hypothetical protein
VVLKFSLASRIFPARSNSIIAWDRLIAATMPFRSAADLPALAFPLAVEVFFRDISLILKVELQR